MNLTQMLLMGSGRQFNFGWTAGYGPGAGQSRYVSAPSSQWNATNFFPSVTLLFQRNGLIKVTSNGWGETEFPWCTDPRPIILGDYVWMEASFSGEDDMQSMGAYETRLPLSSDQMWRWVLPYNGTKSSDITFRFYLTANVEVPVYEKTVEVVCTNTTSISPP